MRSNKNILLIFSFLFFSIGSSAQSKKENFYTFKSTPFTDGFARAHADVDFVFLNKNKQPFSGPIDFRYNKEVLTLHPDSNGIHNIALYPGNYQMSFKDEHGKMQVTDSITLVRGTAVVITVQLDTKKRK
jgi:hypothetical protein